jgi:LysW-gamma-L-lysine carboxypeptidase
VDRIIDQIVNLRSTVEQYRKDTLYDSPSLEIRELNTENDGIVEKATASVVIRLPPSVGVLQMKQAVTEAVGHTIEFTQADPAYLEDMSIPFISKLRQSIKKYGGKGIMKKKLGTSDSVILGPNFNAPCIAYGPGDSKLDHTPDEHIKISEYRKAIDVLENFLLSFDGS